MQALIVAVLYINDYVTLSQLQSKAQAELHK